MILEFSYLEAETFKYFRANFLIVEIVSNLLKKIDKNIDGSSKWIDFLIIALKGSFCCCYKEIPQKPDDTSNKLEMKVFYLNYETEEEKNIEAKWIWIWKELTIEIHWQLLLGNFNS